MGQPYLGEIRMFAGNFAPAGWAFCEGQLLPIAQYDTLFTLIGTTYGGDGQTTFALPDLRGRIPIHQGQGGGLSPYALAESGGVEGVTLTTNQIPSHSHALQASTNAASGSTPAGNVTGTPTTISLYRAATPTVSLNSSGSQPHGNFQPYLCVNFIISLFGPFPSQT